MELSTYNYQVFCIILYLFTYLFLVNVPPGRFPCSNIQPKLMDHCQTGQTSTASLLWSIHLNEERWSRETCKISRYKIYQESCNRVFSAWMSVRALLNDNKSDSVAPYLMRKGVTPPFATSAHTARLLRKLLRLMEKKNLATNIKMCV